MKMRQRFTPSEAGRGRCRRRDRQASAMTGGGRFERALADDLDDNEVRRNLQSKDLP
jgi:hypothetical protein